MGSMKPGIAAQEATKLRCGASTLKTTQVAGWRSAAVTRDDAAATRSAALPGIGPSEVHGMPDQFLVIGCGLLDFDRLICGQFRKALRRRRAAGPRDFQAQDLGGFSETDVLLQGRSAE